MLILEVIISVAALCIFNTSTISPKGLKTLPV